MNRPARRAGLLMILIGVAILVFSFVSTLYALLRPEWVDAQLADSREIIAGNPMFERPGLTYLIAISGAMGVVEAGLSIVLGVLTRRATHWAIVTSLVLTGLRLLIVGLLVLLSLVAVAAQQALGGTAPISLTRTLVLPGIAAIVLLVLVVWLMQALRVEGRQGR